MHLNPHHPHHSLSLFSFSSAMALTLVPLTQIWDSLSAWESEKNIYCQNLVFNHKTYLNEDTH